jgi:hypothetical protein
MNLRELSFLHIGLTDSQPLAGLGNLEHVEFDDCTIRDLSAIAECDGLRTLRLPVGSFFLPSLERLNRLERVEIRGFRREHWRALAGSEQLRELYLKGDIGDDLGLLAELSELRVLELTRTSQRGSEFIQEDLAPLSQLIRLRRLSLAGVLSK